MRRIREAKGISIDALAASAAWDKGNLSKFEQARTKKGGYSHESLERLAKQLELEMWELFTDDFSQTEATIAKLLARSSPDLRVKVQNLLLQEQLTRFVLPPDPSNGTPKHVARKTSKTAGQGIPAQMIRRHTKRGNRESGQR